MKVHIKFVDQPGLDMAVEFKTADELKQVMLAAREMGANLTPAIEGLRPIARPLVSTGTLRLPNTIGGPGWLTLPPMGPSPGVQAALDVYTQIGDAGTTVSASYAPDRKWSPRLIEQFREGQSAPARGIIDSLNRIFPNQAAAAGFVEEGIIDGTRGVGPVVKSIARISGSLGLRNPIVTTKTKVGAMYSLDPEFRGALLHLVEIEAERALAIGTADSGADAFATGGTGANPARFARGTSGSAR